MKPVLAAFAAALILAPAVVTARDTTIKIAAVYPLSGPFAFNGSAVVAGAKHAIDKINAEGGIKSLGGAKLELVTADAGSSPDSAANATTRLLNSEQPAALLGAWSSTFSLSMAPIAERAGIPYITEAFSDAITEAGYRYVFAVDPRSSGVGRQMYEAARDLAKSIGKPLKKIAVVNDNSASAVPMAAAVKKLAQQENVQIIFEQQYTTPLANESSVAVQLRNAAPDVIFMVTYSYSDASRLTGAIKTVGLQRPIIQAGGQGVVPSWLDLGNTALNVATIIPYFPSKSNSALASEMTSKMGLPFVWNDQYLGYTNVMVLREGLEKAGSTKPEAVRDAIAGINLQKGPLGEIIPSHTFSFDQTGRIVGDFYIVAQWQTVDGKLRPCAIWPADQAICKPNW